MNCDSNVSRYLTNTEKLEGFPTLNFISVEDSIERRNKLLESVKNNFNTIKVVPNIFKRYKQSDYENEIITYDWLPLPNEEHVYREDYLGMLGAITSHLKCIKNWYQNTNEDYTIICEDDIYLDVIKYWNFTWEEFLNIIPNDWECVQLQITKANQPPVLSNCSSICYPKTKIKERDICNWGCCAYMINRSRAKKIIDTYYPGDKIFYEYKGCDLSERLSYGLDNLWAYYPSIENIIYTSFEFGKIYSFPLFVENINQKTTVRKNNGQQNLDSYLTVMSWWRDVGKNLSISDFI